MSRNALYMGPRLKNLRRDRGLTQANMAADLDVSASYIALMERNQRPVTAELLLRLATTYGIDIADLARSDSEETTTRMQTVLNDPIFSDIDLPALDVADIAVSYPGFAEALLRLHQAFSEEQLALAERRGAGEPRTGGSAANPAVEARAFLSSHANYFADLDGSAARIAPECDTLTGLRARIKDRHGLEIRFAPSSALMGATRWHDYHRRRVLVNEALDDAGRRFQLALQLAILEQEDAIETALARGRFESEDGRLLAYRALQSYWAAALLMPYDAFAAAATKLRYDIEALAARFSTSFEQAAHRLTTLQRPGAEGVPFFFLRVDRAGNVSKRLGGVEFPFARHGGGCPLWNVHTVFSQPGTLDAQLIELPDGERFVSIARTVRARRGGYGASGALRAIALACSAQHIGKLVYGDALSAAQPAPIGLTCRLCHRPQCVSRSAPPMGREILPMRFRDPGVPFAFSGE